MSWITQTPAEPPPVTWLRKTYKLLLVQELRNSMTESAKNVFNLMDSILFDQVENTQFKSLEEECSNWKEHFPHLRVTGHNYAALANLPLADHNAPEEVAEVIAEDGTATEDDVTPWAEEGAEYLRCDSLCSARLHNAITAGLTQSLAWKVYEVLKSFLVKLGKNAFDRRQQAHGTATRQAAQPNYRITNIPSSSKVGAEQLGHLKNCLKVTSKALHSLSGDSPPILPLKPFPSAKYSRFIPSKSGKLQSISLQKGVVGKKIDTTIFNDHPANVAKNKSPETEAHGADPKDVLGSAPPVEHFKSEQGTQILFTLKKKNLNFERISSAFQEKKESAKSRKPSNRPQTTFPSLKFAKHFADRSVDPLLSITSDKNA